MADAGKLDKFAVARALREMGTLLQLKGENTFKVRAYENGANAIERLSEELATVIAEDRLEDIKGIGASMAEKVTELFRTGTSAVLEQLRKELPPGIVELTQIPGLGPKKVQKLRELGIASVAELATACQTGALRGVTGFGEKTEQKLLEGIKRHQAKPAGGEQRTLLVQALEVGERLLAHVRACKDVVHADLAGSARRWRETVADLDIVVGTDNAEAVMAHFVRFSQVATVDSRGGTKCTVILGNGLQVDLRAVPPEDYWTALHHFTGSKAHHVKLRGLARERGLTISEWGVNLVDSSGKAGDKLLVESEADLYKILGMEYIPPEMREDDGEIEDSLAGGTTDDLLKLGDIQGMVHCHTVFSDGKNTVAEMARAADAMGMKYLTITDHSPTASYANGVQIDRLKQQWDEIAAAQESVKVKLLRGTESDILGDGALDYPDAVLETFDVIIASIHSRMKMSEDEMTKRIVTAMRQPVFKIWGHALGRLLLERDPFACRVEEVLDAIAESRAAIEVNGDPHRLDLEAKWLRRAKQRGIRFVVSTDAHSTAQLANLRFGVAMARRGGLRQRDVLNALPFAKFREAVRPA